MRSRNRSSSRWPLTARTRNLVRFCHHLPHEALDESFMANYGFRDAGSRFSILKSVHTAPGPDECYGLFARDDRTVFRKLLGLEVDYLGLPASEKAKGSVYNSMNYYRSHIVEHFCHNGTTPMPPTEGECRMWFPAADMLRVSYQLMNKSEVGVPVRLRWFSEGEPGLGFNASPRDHGFTFETSNRVISHDYRSRAEILAKDDDVTFSAEGSRLVSGFVERVIPPQGILTCHFALRFAFNDEALPTWPKDLWSERSLDRAISAAEKAYAGLPTLDRGMKSHQDLALKAAGTLRTLRYRDFDLKGRAIMTVHVGKSGTAATWFWDTGISLLGLGVMKEREGSPGAIRLLIGGIKPDGTPPVTYERQEYLYQHQMPILAWGIGHYLSDCMDRRLLREVYEPLGRYVRQWVKRHSTASGLVLPAASCLDDALRWYSGSPLVPERGKPWHSKDWGRSRDDLFESPDTNAYLYLEMRTLAAMARELGKPSEAKDWEVEAARLALAINERLLEPKTLTYQDRNIETGAFTGMIHLGSFIPVYAGIAPKRVATHLCRDYLLSPDHFLTDMPFPVVDRAHPTYRSGGFLHEPPQFPGALVQHSYWRGRTWIHGDYWMIGALWQSGCRREADEIADRVLTAVAKSEGIHECYDSLTGYGNGHPEFLWSASAVLMLAYRHYRRPPVAIF